MTTKTTPFTAKEAAYLAAHQLGRLATIGPDGSPHVVPVAFRFNPDATIDIGGPNLGTSQKYRAGHQLAHRPCPARAGDHPRP